MSGHSRAGTGGSRDQVNEANVKLREALGKAAGSGASAENRMSAAPTQSTAALLQVRSHRRAARPPTPSHPLPRRCNCDPPNCGVTQPRGWRAPMPHTGESVARGVEGRGACRRRTRLAPGCCIPPAALFLRGVRSSHACHAACLDQRALAHLESLRRHLHILRCTPPHIHPLSHSSNPSV